MLPRVIVYNAVSLDGCINGFAADLGQFYSLASCWREDITLVTQSTPREYLDYLERRHIGCIVAGEGQVDFRLALEQLQSRYGARVVDEVGLLIYPSLVGGVTPASMFRAPDVASPENSIPLCLIHVEQMPNDAVWLRYEVVK